MTLYSIFKQFKWRISLTIGLVVLEGCLFVLFPLVIGFAIDDLLNNSYTGLVQLAALGIAELVIGSARRCYDTRVYAGIYEALGVEVIVKDKSSSTSVLTARVNMLEELVEFFENTFPELFHSVINIAGTIIILFTFSLNIFYGCVLLAILTVIVFGVTSRRTINYNHHYNNALEQQVDVIENKQADSVKLYIRGLMRWNIKLSDLETINFSIVWLCAVGLLLFAIVDTVQVSNSTVQYGAVLSVVMYVFQYADGIIEIPENYQEWLRLKEISSRLSQDEFEDEHENEY